MIGIIASILFYLATAFAADEQLAILHDPRVHVIAPQCDRVDQMSNACHIGAGEIVTELRVEMPCTIERTQLFFSVVRWGYMNNWSEWVINPEFCGQRRMFPLMLRGE
jgi:hypothetical protein